MHSWVKENENKSLRVINKLMDWEQSIGWPGRTGAYDQVVFQAHLKIAAKAFSLEYAASCRELAELAGISAPAALHANKRLIESYHLLEISKPSTCSLSSRYQVVVDVETLTLPHSGEVGECKGFAYHDAFRYAGLGKSSLQIWDALKDSPKSMDDLQRATGRTIRTIKKHLNRMARIVSHSTGEIIEMVRENEGLWYQQPVNLDLVAEILGTNGKGEDEQRKHAEQRKIHNMAIRHQVPQATTLAECNPGQ